MREGRKGKGTPTESKTSNKIDCRSLSTVRYPAVDIDKLTWFLLLNKNCYFVDFFTPSSTCYIFI